MRKLKLKAIAKKSAHNQVCWKDKHYKILRWLEEMSLQTAAAVEDVGWEAAGDCIFKNILSDVIHTYSLDMF